MPQKSKCGKCNTTTTKARARKEKQLAKCCKSHLPKLNTYTQNSCYTETYPKKKRNKKTNFNASLVATTYQLKLTTFLENLKKIEFKEQTDLIHKPTYLLRVCYIKSPLQICFEQAVKCKILVC